MDLQNILAQLHQERQHVSQVIASLERLAQAAEKRKAGSAQGKELSGPEEPPAAPKRQRAAVSGK